MDSIKNFNKKKYVETVKEFHLQNRLNQKSKTTNVLAFVFIMIFLVLFTISFFEDKTLPTYFISIISTIIGYYFGSKNND